MRVVLRRSGRRLVETCKLGELLATAATVHWSRERDSWLVAFYNVQDQSVAATNAPEHDLNRRHYQLWSATLPDEKLLNGFVISGADLVLEEILALPGFHFTHVQKIGKLTRDAGPGLQRDFEHPGLVRLLRLMSFYGKSPDLLPQVIAELKDEPGCRALDREDPRIGYFLHSYLRQPELAPPHNSFAKRRCLHLLERMFYVVRPHFGPNLKYLLDLWLSTHPSWHLGPRWLVPLNDMPTQPFQCSIEGPCASPAQSSPSTWNEFASMCLAQLTARNAGPNY